MTPLLIAYGVMGTFLAVLAVLVLAARPAHPTNRAFAALLLLEAASSVAYQLMRESPTDAAAEMYGRLGQWYLLPMPLVTLLLLHHLVPPARPSPTRRWGLALAAALTAAALAAFALDGALFITNVRVSGAFRFTGPGPLALAHGAATYLVQTLAVVVGARAAVSPERSSIGRRQAALVGLAFIFLIAHASVALLLGLALNPSVLPRDPVSQALFVPSILGLIAAAWAAQRLSRAFDGPERRFVAVAALLPFLGAVVDVAANVSRSAGFPVPEWWVGTRVLWVALFSLTLAVALVRFGLAGFGEAMQRRVARLAHGGLLAATVALPAGVALALTQGSAAWAVAAAVLTGAAFALSPAPLRSLSRALAGFLLVDPRDPGVVGERARVYAAALEAHLAPDGTLADADASTLRALRRELDITEREHALLLQGLALRRGQDQALLGRYRVERELGRGAFGTALLATDPVRGEQVVLKRFHAGKMERRALAEARALAAVQHPRVLPLLDVQRVGEEIFLVLAYAEGGSLRDLLEREGPLPPAGAAKLMAEVLEGLEALHKTGLVHRDVKPSNILLDAQGRAMLGDFGSARFVSVPELEATLTGGEVAGSYATIAPEVLRGERATAAADLYSAAAVLYRLLTGQHYLELADRNALQLRQAILHEPPRLPHPRVPAALAPLLARALAKRPEERPRDAAEFRRALEAARSDARPRAAPAPAEGARGTPRRRRGTAAAGPA